MHTPTAPARRDARTAFAIAICGGLLALAMRWYYVTHAQVLQPLDLPNVRADAVDYYRYAWNMVHHATFANDLPGALAIHANSFRDPGYPALLALWMTVTGSYDAWYAGVLVTQALLGALTVSLLVLAVRGRMPNVLLAIAAMLMAVWPHSVAMSSFVLSENLLAFLCAAALVCLRRATDRPRLLTFVASGVLFSLATLTNAVLLPIAVIVALVLCFRRITGRRTAAALALASLLLPAAWGIRNMTIAPADGAVQRASMNLVQGSWPTYHAAYQLAMRGDAEGLRTSAAIDSEIASFQQGTSTGLSTLCNRMCAAPITYLWWYLEKPVLLWSWDIRIGQGDIYVYPTRHSPFRTVAAWRGIEAICFMLNPLLLLLAAGGAVAAVLRRSTSGIEPAMAIVVVAITAVYMILQSEPRYSVAFRGIEIILAATGLAAFRSLRPRNFGA
jgi:4-amino-4-deoxy-L-arabinose transferase-like glycosyltransferase